jgi:hypothetical protein
MQCGVTVVGELCRIPLGALHMSCTCDPSAPEWCRFYLVGKIRSETFFEVRLPPGVLSITRPV